MTLPPSATIAQPITAGIVGAIAGFASSFALVIAGLQAVGATPAEASSGLLVLCVFQGVTAIALTLRYRLPISIAWSTPGAALLIAAQQTTGDYSAAIGAFLLAGALYLVTGLWPWLARLMTRIPKPIASAMLAGILFPICLAPVQAAISDLWMLALPPILVWLVLIRLAPRWAVAGAVVATVVVVTISNWGVPLTPSQLAPTISFTLPTFDPVVLVGLGVPLYIVTMAGQNIPGFAVLSTFGFDHPPARAILAGSGIATMAGSFFGGYTLNLSALTAAMFAGPDSHPDRSKRWIATLTSGSAYIVLGLGAGLATTLVSVSPPILITAVAGLALLGAFAQAATTALEVPEHRIVAVVTFLVVVAGIPIAGIGSAFWGLIVGGVVMLVTAWRPRRRLAARRSAAEAPAGEGTAADGTTAGDPESD
jgi:benzoate membrane transport protein